MKSGNRKADAVLLDRQLRTDELTHWEIQQVLLRCTVEDIKKMNEGGDPLLHMACHLCWERIGARRLLLVFFEDPVFRPLFVDPTYTDRYELRPIDWLRKKKGTSSSMGWFILDDIIHEFGDK